jgi:hypothetical protein
MGPTEPAPPTRAAARRSAAAAGPRVSLLHTLALSAGAFAGALIVLGVGSLAGVSSIESPIREVSDTQQVADPAPRPTPIATPRSSPTADVTASDQVVEPAPPVEVAAAAPTEPQPAPIAPAPEPSEPAPEPLVAEPTPESGPGNSDSAPGKNKPPKP